MFTEKCEIHVVMTTLTMQFEMKEEKRQFNQNTFAAALEISTIYMWTKEL